MVRCWYFVHVKLLRHVDQNKARKKPERYQREYQGQNDIGPTFFIC